MQDTEAAEAEYVRRVSSLLHACSTFPDSSDPAGLPQTPGLVDRTLEKDTSEAPTISHREGGDCHQVRFGTC